MEKHESNSWRSPNFIDSMLCVGGRVTEHSTLRPNTEADPNFRGQLNSQGHHKGEGRIEQRLLSPLRSLALSPIPHMAQPGNQHLHQYHSHTDLLLSNSDLYNLDLLSESEIDSNPYRGGTGTLPRGYKYKPNGKMTQDEDVYDTIPGSLTHDNRDTDIYGSIPRDYQRNVPKRTSSFQQLPRTSTTLVRSQSCKLTSADRPQYKTATRKYLYDENCIPEEDFLKPINPPLKRKNRDEGSKKSAFNVRTAIKRKLASLTGHSKEDIRATGSESSSYERLPVMECIGKERAWSGHHPQRTFQAYKGQMKLSVYMNYGLLTVHVMQGRHFSSKWKSTCDSYVKVSLVPDGSRRTRCKTETVYDTNSPNFDQKFSFELLDEDERKRLVISVWHRDDLTDRTDLLGCMSFGVHHIRTQRKVVNGWYYLLGEDVGRRKHMEVQQGENRRPLAAKNQNRVSGVPKPTKPFSESKGIHVPPVNKDVLWMDPHVIMIKRTRQGFGFSVTGTCPVQVCSVDDNSSAAAAGLQRGDCIVRINGQNVSRSSSDSVARLVRHANKKILLDIQRPKMLTHSSIDRSLWQPLSSTLLSESSDSDSDSDDEDHGVPMKLEDLCSLDEMGSSTLRNSMKMPKKKVTWGPNKWLNQMR